MKSKTGLEIVQSAVIWQRNFGLFED